MAWANACYCSNEECARAGRCLKYDGAFVSPLIPSSQPWSIPIPITDSRPSKLIATIDDDDVLRIAKKVVELLTQNKKTGDV